DPASARERLQDVLGIGELRNPARADERGGLDAPLTGRGQRPDQPQLPLQRNDAQLVLESVPGTDLVDVDAARESPGQARGWMFCRIHWTMSCVELPGVKISETPRPFSRGMSSSGMMPPPNTPMSDAFDSLSSSSTAGKSVMWAPDMMER